MQLELEEFTEQHAREVCCWRYDGEYAIYDYPAWDKASNNQWAITVADKRRQEFSALVDGHNNLCGYIRLQGKNDSVLIGVGLRPSLCGQGLGNVVMEIVKQQCKLLYSGRRVVLEVRSFNERAIKCYKRAGFEVKETYKKDTPIGYGEFVRMEFRC